MSNLLSRWAPFVLALLAVAGCQTVELQRFPGTEGKPAGELGWIVTPITTVVHEVDGEDVIGVYRPLPADNLRYWIAVVPGQHELKLSYMTPYVRSAAASTFSIDSVAGKTNYIFGRAGGGIRYYHLLLDRPADEALIRHIDARVSESKLPCPTLPCAD